MSINIENIKSAILFDRPDEYEGLISAHADITEIEDISKNTLPILICQYKRLNLLQLTAKILDNEAALTAWINRRNNKQYTAIYYAVVADDPAMIQYLISIGADLNLQYPINSSLLHVACENNSIRALIILEKHLNINAQNYAGMTPLMIATLSDNDDCLRFLIADKAKIEMKDVGQNTALHIAVSREHLRNIYFLLMAGANYRSRNRAGLTPLALASKMEDKSIPKLFQCTGFWGWLSNFDIPIPEMRKKTKFNSAILLFIIFFVVIFIIEIPCTLIRHRPRSHAAHRLSPLLFRGLPVPGGGEI